MKTSKDLIVTQSNDLINAIYQLKTVGAARLMRLLIAQIDKNDQDFKTYKIEVEEFADIFELKGHDVYAEVEKAAESLAHSPISIKHGKSYLYANWLSAAKYIDGNGYVELRLDADLKPFLLKLKDKYTQYELDFICKIKNPLYIRLYEILKEAQGLEYWKTGRKGGVFKKLIEYPDLREIIGMDKGTHKLFADFRIYYLNQAKKVLNASSDIAINDIKIDKKGRAFHYITFICDENKQMMLNINEVEPKLIEVSENTKHPDDVKQLISFGITEEIAYKWRKKYGVARVIRNLGYVTAKKNAGKVKEDLAGYVASAIANDYGKSWIDKAKIQEEEKKKEELEALEKKQQEINHGNKRKEELEALIKSFYALSNDQALMIKNEFYLALDESPKFQWDKIIKSGENPEIASLFKARFFDVYKSKNQEQ